MSLFGDGKVGEFLQGLGGKVEANIRKKVMVGGVIGFALGLLFGRK